MEYSAALPVWIRQRTPPHRAARPPRTDQRDARTGACALLLDAIARRGHGGAAGPGVLYVVTHHPGAWAVCHHGCLRRLGGGAGWPRPQPLPPVPVAPGGPGLRADPGPRAPAEILSGAPRAVDGRPDAAMARARPTGHGFLPPWRGHHRQHFRAARAPPPPVDNGPLSRGAAGPGHLHAARRLCRRT